MRSVLKQLCCREIGNELHVQEELLNEFRLRKKVALQQGTGVMPLMLQDCISFIGITVNENPATIVIDAVDELNNERHTLFIASSTGLIKVLLTGRTDERIMSYSTTWQSLELTEKFLRPDMTLSIDESVTRVLKSRRLLGGHISSGLKTDLSSKLRERSQGM